MACRRLGMRFSTACATSTGTPGGALLASACAPSRSEQAARIPEAARIPAMAATRKVGFRETMLRNDRRELSILLQLAAVGMLRPPGSLAAGFSRRPGPGELV